LFRISLITEFFNPIATMIDSMQEQPQTPNTVWHRATVTRARREQMNGHKSVVLWFTGLSGAGKSTIAHAVEERLYQLGCRTYVLDGDNVRHGLCGDLGFSITDRHENIRRVGEMTKLYVNAGIIALTAFISPLRADRDQVRRLVGKDFIEIHCSCPIDICESRDVKGLYKKARAGEIKDFTGISSPYEEPDNPELVIDSNFMTVAESVDAVLACLHSRGIVATTEAGAHVTDSI
jgi:adenylylsulfate kinase